VPWTESKGLVEHQPIPAIWRVSREPRPTARGSTRSEASPGIPQGSERVLATSFPGLQARSGPETAGRIGSHGPGPVQTSRPGPGFLIAGRPTAVLDTRMRIVGWSPEAATQCGHSPGDVLGRPRVQEDESRTAMRPVPVKSGSPGSGAAALPRPRSCFVFPSRAYALTRRLLSPPALLLRDVPEDAEFSGALPAAPGTVPAALRRRPASAHRVEGRVPHTPDRQVVSALCAAASY